MIYLLSSLCFMFHTPSSYLGVLSTADCFLGIAPPIQSLLDVASTAGQNGVHVVSDRTLHRLWSKPGMAFRFRHVSKTTCLGAATLKSEQRLCDSGRICPSNVRYRRCASASPLTQSSFPDMPCHIAVGFALDDAEG